MKRWAKVAFSARESAIHEHLHKHKNSSSFHMFSFDTFLGFTLKCKVVNVKEEKFLFKSTWPDYGN